MINNYWKDANLQQMVFDLSPEAIVILDKKGIFVEANNRLFDWLGYSPAEVVGKSLLQVPFFSKESKFEVIKKFTGRMKGEKIDAYELEFIDKNGRIRIGEIRGSTIKDADGKIIGDVVLVADVTERRKFLRIYEALIKATPDAVTITDHTGKILFVSKRTVQMHGYANPGELVGKKVEELIVSEERGKAVKNLLLTLEKGEVREVEYRLLKKDGSIFPAELNAATISDEKGQVIGFIATSRDVSQRKSAEQKLTERAEELVSLNKSLEEGRLAMMNILEDTKALESTLRQERDRINSIIAAMGEGLIVIDTDYKICMVNKMAAELLGVDEKSVIGKLWADVVVGYTADGKEIPKEMRAYQKVLSGKQNVVTGLEAGHYYRSSSGKLFPIISVTTYLPGVGVVKVFRDMTEEVKYKQALQAQKDLADGIIRSMGEGLMVINDEYRITRLNLVAEEMLGMTEAEAMGKKWSDIVKAFEGESEIPFEKRTFTKVVTTGETVVTQLTQDHSYLNLRGKKIPLISVTTPLVTEGKVGAIKVFRDATVEKESRRIIEYEVEKRTSELKQEQALSHSILENAGEGIVLTNESGEVIYVNPSFLRITGYQPEDLMGLDYAEWVEAYDLQDKKYQAKELSDAAAVTAPRQESRMQIKGKSGNKIAVMVNSAPIKVGNEFKGVVRVVHDYTEELNLQKQKDDFFSIASHELRTPLTVISGNLEMLAGYYEKALNREGKQILTDSQEAADRLINMIENFLNVSRLDQGRLKVEIKKIDVCQVLTEATNELKVLAKKKKVELKVVCPSSPVVVEGDETLLKEIIVNLVGNSVKFTNDGEVVAEVKRESNKAMVWVRDTGVGIAKDKQDRLFQRFQQAMERTLSREAGGTGLGLYISREFAKMMGGDLKLVQSDLGKGSIFALELPLVDSVS